MTRSFVTLASFVMLQIGCSFTGEGPASDAVDEVVQETALEVDVGPDPSQKVAVPESDERR